MFSTLRNRFGIPGVISVIALVFAMFGGAYAASNSSNGGQATASAKAKKGPKGPKGAKGDTGATGPQGPAGVNGKDGANGSNGAAGAAGQSVSGAPIAAGGACGTGVSGVKYTLGATSTNVCNGKEGAAGETGFTETLPPGETEMGHWAFGASPNGSGPGVTPYNLAPISFAIPYPEAEGPELIYVENGQTDPECPGTVQEPAANPGFLCAYEGEASPFFQFKPDFTEGIGGTNAAGVTLLFESEKKPYTQVVWNENTNEPEPQTTEIPTSQFATGTWAVTAPVTGP